MKRTLTSLIVATGMLAAPAAWAQITSGTVSAAGATCSGAGGVDGDCRNSAQTLTNNGTTFATRYAWNINADTGIFSTHDTSGNARHSLNFNATAAGGYRLDITTSRVGAMGRSNDASGCEGAADTGGVTGSTNIALSSGSLDIGDPGAIGNGGSDTSTPYSQTSSPATIFRVSNGAAQGHSLSFTWTGSVRSNSCEASVRQGESSGTTSGCAVCGYPGNPSRTASTDGHFVTVTFTSLCGNGTVDGSVGEQCDPPGVCCTSTCQFASSSTVCRASAGVCDLQENCTGGSAACPADAKTTAVCRASAGVCDIAESCNGVANTCPANAFQSSSTMCRASAGVCDIAENCTGSSAACPANVFQSSSTVCRASAGVCDIAENCTGSSAPCPADAFQPSSTVCRASAGVCDPAENCTGAAAVCPADLKSTAQCRAAADLCDVAENCDGVSDTCPADQIAPNGTVCRPAAGDCDVAETCDGVSIACPADGVAGVLVECRPVAGDCDVVENCDGVGTGCPADAFQPSTLECRASGGVCDPAENCTGTSASCPADVKSTSVCRASADICDLAETCDGVNDACPADAKSTAVCRASAGICDLAESCDGVTDACPADAKSTAECRASTAACDPAETCDGVGDSCPADALVANGTECRAAAGGCDVAEACDGVSAACPADQIVPNGTICRPSAGTCDIVETCDGVSVACPGDSVLGAFVACRPSAGDCDVPENCDGVNAACPADAFQPATVECRASGGLCDLAENCTGTSATCPADAKSTAECRAAAGTCDVAESCDGVANTCPADVLASFGAVCRPASGTCDVQEVCTGLVATCPADVLLPDGTPCNDGSACTGPDQCTAGACSGEVNADSCADDFLCYKVKAPPVAPMTVSLADQFETGTATVKKLRHLCTPGDKNAEGVFDTTTHLVSYQIKPDVRHVRRTNILVENQIGSLRLDTTKTDLLLVPSNKNLTADPPAPNISLINVDHYKCYKVKVTPGTPRLAKGITVSVEDQFNNPAKVFTLKKPKHLCNPVDKNGEGIKNPDAHLLCYGVKGVSGQPKHVRQSGVHINNQIGVSIFGTTKEAELCIPSIKTL
jgi:hypothetical protein